MGIKVGQLHVKLNFNTKKNGKKNVKNINYNK